ncbi:hypothetical protein SteCoe_8065 [Stentor coeruleus]|uniref:Reelin domain-containing protein n=1 Tax=Stentor coeruleus TaxID=5963 RepID=A0A1R2CL41_9CILI|nr:hypothetical protein SteCoe_8065 [Stentor coeruleus]
MLVFLILLSLTSSEPLSSLDLQTTPNSLSNPYLSQAVGSNCGASNIYQIYGVDVNPWPPTPGMTALLTMVGLFVQGTFVQEIVLGTCYNGMVWNYDPVDINKSYPTGAEVQFEMIVTFPNEAGSYISNIQITAGVHICCWQFSYNIS